MMIHLMIHLMINIMIHIMIHIMIDIMIHLMTYIMTNIMTNIMINVMTAWKKSALPQRPALKKIPHWTQLVKRLAWRAVVAAFCSSARKASQTGKHQTIPLKEAYGIWAWVNVTKWCHYEHTIFIFTGDGHHGFPWPLRFRHDLGHPGAGAAALLGTRQLAHPGTFDAGLPGRQILLPLFEVVRNTFNV